METSTSATVEKPLPARYHMFKSLMKQRADYKTGVPNDSLSVTFNSSPSSRSFVCLAFAKGRLKTDTKGKAACQGQDNSSVALPPETNVTTSPLSTQNSTANFTQDSTGNTAENTKLNTSNTTYSPLSEGTVTKTTTLVGDSESTATQTKTTFSTGKTHTTQTISTFRGVANVPNNDEETTVQSPETHMVDSKTPSTSPKSTQNVLVPTVICGLILAAALIGVYIWKNPCFTKASGMKLGGESYIDDEANQGNTLVSVAPLNPPESPEKPNQNGESLEAVKNQNPPAATNGHSTTKADTEL